MRLRRSLLLTALLLSCSSGEPTYSLDEGTPEELGMDPAVLDEARRYAFADGKNTQAVVVVRSGTVVAEWYAEDRDQQSLASSWSIAKSVTSAVVRITTRFRRRPTTSSPKFSAGEACIPSGAA